MSRRLRETIPLVLVEERPATGPELAAYLDVHPGTVERCCRELQATGRIRLGTGGQYVVDGARENSHDVASD